LTAFHRGLLLVALFCIVAGVSWRGYKSVGFIAQAVLTLSLGMLAKTVVASDTHPYYWIVIALCTLYWLPWPGHPQRFGIINFAVGFVALTALTHIVFFGEDRYHIVTTPLLILCAAAAFGPPKSHGSHASLARRCG
jgi:uncharacterized membrane protein YqjE